MKVALVSSSDSYHNDFYDDMPERATDGVLGFLDMNQETKTFLSELDDVNNGDMVISRNFVKYLTQTTANAEDKLDHLLTDRELRILEMIGNGSTNREIGEGLYISEHTVKVHLGAILNKLHLKNRQQAAAYIAQKRVTDELVAGRK